MNSKNVTGGRFFGLPSKERRQVSFFFCKKRNKKKMIKAKILEQILMEKYRTFYSSIEHLALELLIRVLKVLIKKSQSGITPNWDFLSKPRKG